MTAFLRDPERPITVADDLPVFAMGLQPQTCGACGSRTRIDAQWTRRERPSGRLTENVITCQHHVCLNPRCGIQSVVEFDPIEQDESEDDECDDDTCPHCGAAL